MFVDFHGVYERYSQDVYRFACFLCGDPALAEDITQETFGRIISDTSWDVSPRNFIITAAIAMAFWIAFAARTVWIRRHVYGKSAVLG